MKHIRDPIYSEFIELDDLSLKIISNPYFQRMRRIKHLGLADYIYPGATHTRFSHMLGAYHLATKFIREFRSKGEDISDYDYDTIRLAALLHDIGHTSLSHALEYTLMPFTHEEIGKAIIKSVFGNILQKELIDGIIDIFERRSEPFKYQLIESQMDVDRLDYLRRDAYYCGVDYGMIDVERIIRSSTLFKGANGREFVITTKGIFAAESYIIARYLMYWSVYYHKTNIGFQSILFSLFKRFKDLISKGVDVWAPRFLKMCINAKTPEEVVPYILHIDDSLVFYTIQVWQEERDKILSDLAKRLINRVRFKAVEVKEDFVEMYRNLSEKCEKLGYDPKYYIIERTPKDIAYSPYNPNSEEHIKVLVNGKLMELSSILPTDTLKSLSREVYKRYIFVPEEVILS